MRDDHPTTTGAEYPADGETPEKLALDLNHVRECNARYHEAGAVTHPMGGKGSARAWKNETYGPEAWGPGDNTGINLGRSRLVEQSETLTFIDFDCDQRLAVITARHWLPSTEARWGRKGKRSSHYGFLSDYAETAETAVVQLHLPGPDGKPSVALELRTGCFRPNKEGIKEYVGAQSIMPPGVWTSKADGHQEYIEWEPDCDLTKATILLRDDAKRIWQRWGLQLVLLAHWPNSEHGVMMALGGWLLRLGWTLDEARDFVRKTVDTLAELGKPHEDRKKAQETAEAGWQYVKDNEGSSNKGYGLSRIRELFGGHPDVGELKKLGLVMEGVNSAVDEYNEKYAACLISGGGFRVAHMDLGPNRPLLFQSRTDFLHACEPEAVLNAEGKFISKGKLWLGSRNRRFYREVEFRPGEPQAESNANGILNLWPGWAAQPNPDVGKCEGWLDLVWEVICGEDEEAYVWLMNWLAHMVQFPMDRPTTTPGIIGVPGAGKKNRANFKSLVSDEKRIDEAKYAQAKVVNNFMRLISLTNYHDGLPAEDRDRRNSVIDMKDRKVAAVLKDRVVAEMKGKGPAALLHYLLNWTVDPEAVRHNLVNEALADLKDQIRDPMDAWWQDILQTGGLLPETLMWAQHPEKIDWPGVVGLDALEYSMRRRTAKHPNRYSLPTTHQDFLKRLRVLTGNDGLGLQRKRRVFNKPTYDRDDPIWPTLPQEVREMNAQQRYILVSPLAQCRAAFEKKIGQGIDWGTGANDPTEFSAKEEKDDQDTRPRY